MFEKNRYLFFIFLFLLPFNRVNAQFDSVIAIFSGFSFNLNLTEIYPLGDYNNDGYDDILIYSCSDNSLRLYYGGNPMDSLPHFVWHLKNTKADILAIDLNDDGINDLVVTEQTSYRNLINVYYGQSNPDTIPGLSFYAPPGSSINNFGTLFGLKDFNGDGRSELVIFDASIPFQTLYTGGCFYFYNTGNQFDTIPHFIITGDSVSKKRIEYLRSGDINGDGLTDFTIYGYKDTYPAEPPFREWYLGNAQWNLTPVNTWYQSEHNFNISYLDIVNDINRDGKDDILINSYGNFYPYYYYNSILYGSYPIDTIPDIGLNTQNLAVSGSRIDRVGDLNGDGYNDLFLPLTPGISYPVAGIWLGQRVMPELPVKRWFAGEDGFTSSISSAGDVDGDGINDIAIGERGYHYQCETAKVYIIKGDSSATTAINEGYKTVPSDFKLYKPYPNPFNPETTIKWVQVKREKTTIKIYNSLGRKEAELYNNDTEAGEHEIIFNAGRYNLSSGVYFIEIRTTDQSKREKIIYLK